MTAEPFNGKPRDPAMVECGWCEKPSTKATELLSSPGIGKGTFVYSCPRHHQKAEDMRDGMMRTTKQSRRR